MDQKHLRLVRITHKKADVSIREKYALSYSERNGFYLLLKDVLDINEALVLSTCNRTEIYYLHETDLNFKVIKLLSNFKGFLSDTQDLSCFERITDQDQALLLLFQVAIGLDSLVLGDQQIFGQVKEAYRQATDLGFAHSYLHRAMHSVFYSHKLVCQDTVFKDGAASISYNATKIIKTHDLNTPILVIGAGKMGEDLCRNLLQVGFQNITVANRTLSKSKTLAKELGIDYLEFGKMNYQIGDYKVVFSAITCESPLFEKTEQYVMHPKLTVIDIATPRSISKKFISSSTQAYYDVDDIGNLTAETLSNRQKEIPKVHSLISTCIEEFKTWTEEHLQTSPLKKFKEILDELRRESLASYIHKVDDETFQSLDEFSQTMIKKLIKLPAVQLKQHCQKDKALELGQALNDLFNVEPFIKTN